VDLRPLADALEVRAEERPGAPAVRRQAGSEQRCHAALAVGAGHQDRFETLLRVAYRLQQRLRSLETGLHAEALQVEQPRQRCVVAAHVSSSQAAMRPAGSGADPPAAADLLPSAAPSVGAARPATPLDAKSS